MIKLQNVGTSCAKRGATTTALFLAYAPAVDPVSRRELPGRIVMTIGLAMSLSCVALIIVLIVS